MRLKPSPRVKKVVRVHRVLQGGLGNTAHSNQGSYAPWKSWKTLDFYFSPEKPLKILESKFSPGKPWKTERLSWV